MMRFVAIFDTALIVLYAILFLVQLWNKPFGDEFFVKLTVTMTALLVTATVVGLIYREFVKDKELKKDNYIS